MRTIRLLATASAICITATIVTPALAQETGDAAQATDSDKPLGFEEIVVTARRAEENLQTVPVAVTAIGGDALTQNGSFTPLDLAQIAPGIRATGAIGDKSNVVYSIRGQSFGFGTSFPAVIPYFAEVPIVSEFSTGSFFDLENIQILRGPQGVRFGRVTDGGAVLLQPKKPTNEFGGYVKATVGDYDRQTLEGAVNLPIVDDAVLLRVSGERARVGGYSLNLVSGRELDDVHYDSIRVGLTLRPAPGLENTTFFQYNHADENGNSNVFNAYRPGRRSAAQEAILAVDLAEQIARGPRIVENGSLVLGPDAGIFNERRQTIVSNITTADLTPDITLRNIVGYARTKAHKGFDYDGSSESIVDSYGRIVPRLDDKHISEELQVTGLTGIVGWTIGGYMDRQSPGGPYEQVIFFGPSLGTPGASASFSRQTKTSRALYAQAEIDLASMAPGLKVNGGLRYTKDKITSVAALSRITIPFANFLASDYIHGTCEQYTCLTNRFSKNVVTYEFGASYEVNPDLFTYVSYRRGYRPGGVDQTVSVTVPNPTYDPEYDNSLEVGVKLDTVAGTVPVRINIAAFYDKYTDIQKRINYIDQNETPVITVLNATKATIKGFEFEGDIEPVTGLNLGLNLAYTDAAYDTDGADLDVLYNDVDGACNPTVSRNIGFCPFNMFAATPKWQMTASLGYTLPLDDAIGDVRFGFDVYHQSKMAYNDVSALTPDAVGPAYTLVNANLTWARVMDQNLDLSAFITNLTDKDYLVGMQSVTQQASAGIGGAMYGPPRMFGVSAKVYWGGE